MKDNLEDLLKQVYERKEVPSQEFCQSIIQKMKGGNKAGFLWKKESSCYKGILRVAICAGIIILAGIGVHFYRQEGLLDREAYWKQEILKQENQVSDVTENPSDGNNKIDATSTPDNVQESSGENAKYPQREDEASGNMSGSERNSLEKPGETADRAGKNNAERTESDSDIGSGNRKPQIMETTQPMRTSKPTETLKPMGTSKPAKTSNPMPPQKTPRPQENYIAVCSIETYVYSSNILISEGQEVDRPSSVFDSQIILSYEQLQSLIGKIEKQLVQTPDHDLKNILQQLRGYDQSYFASNALCINMSYMDAGMNVGLRAVWVRDMWQGNYYLDIWLDKVCDEADQASGVKFYSSFVTVPQTIAGQCNMVQFHFFEEN